MPNHAKYLVCVLSCLGLFLVSTPVKSAEVLSLSGTIVDQSHSPIPGATINLYATTTLVNRMQTGTDGRFEFPNLVPGTYVLECYQEGFQKLSRRIVLRDRPEALDLTLEVAGLNQHVVVIASELPELPSEISKSVSLISNEELTNRDVVTLTEGLRQIPSLQIQQQGGPGTLSAYRFRGLRPEDTAILLDGFRFLDPSDNKNSVRPLLSNLLLTDADHVEVLRGAGSTLYGTNAIGGIVNVVSRQPTEPLAGNLSFQGGSLGLLRGSGGVSGQSDGQQYTYSLQADHVNYTRGLDKQDTYRNNSGTLRSTYDWSSLARLFARFQFADIFSFLNQSPSPLSGLTPLPPGEFVRDAKSFPEPGANFYPQFNDPDYHQHNRFFGGAVRLDHAVNGFWNYSIGYQSLRTRRRYEDGPAVSPLAQSLGFQGPPTVTSDRYQGAMDQVFWRNSFQFGSANSTDAALDFDRAGLDQTAFGLRTQAVQRSLALQVRHQIRLLEGRWQWQIAFRAQHYDLGTPRFSNSTDNPYGSILNLHIPATYSGDVSTAYFFSSSGTKVRLHAGNGYRSPSLYERIGGGSFGSFRSYYGDPKLRTEHAYFIDGGFDQFAFHNKLQVSGTYFYTHLQTIIDFGPTPYDPFNRSYGYLNLKGGNARGFELSVSSRPMAFLDFNSSYTFTKSIQPSPTSAGTTRVLGLSGHQFTVGLNVCPARRFNLNLQGSAVSSYDYPVFGLVYTIPTETYRFQGYTLLDFTGTYVLRESEKSRLRFVVRVDNLLNQEYFQGGFLAPKATARAGFHFDF